MTFALPLAPPQRIEEAFTLIRAEIPSFAINPRTEHFANEYLIYIQDTYMSASFGTAEAGLHWNFYNRLEEGQMTNNPSDAFLKQRSFLACCLCDANKCPYRDNRVLREGLQLRSFF